jgi:hypothetical protein
MDNYLDTKKYGTSNVFDLITIGQALHWFNEEEIFPFVQKSLRENGTVGIFAYKKQHFKVGEPLYLAFEEYFQLIKPYFECDTDNNDNNYYKFNFKKYFQMQEPKFFEEETLISLNKLITFLQSWSAYYNYKKSRNEDPLIKFKENCKSILSREDDDIVDIKYYNFYYVILLQKL